MALVADLINSAVQTNNSLMRLEPLLALLSDTETLSLFIRHSGLSKEQGAALVRELGPSPVRDSGGLAHPRVELDDALAKIRPTSGDVAGSYRANSQTAIPGFTAPEVDARPYTAAVGRAGEFTAYSPTLQDYIYTVDDISSRDGSTRQGHGVPPGWFTPIDTVPERIRGISAMACIVLACLLGVPVFIIFLLFG